jgi:hypothetical protein
MATGGTAFDMGKIFGDLFQEEKKGGLPDSEKIELQREMIFALVKQVDALEKKVSKLTGNNNKAMPKIAELDKRMKGVEERHMLIDEEQADKR